MTLPVRSPCFRRAQEALQEPGRLVEEPLVPRSAACWARSTLARVMCSNSRR